MRILIAFKPQFTRCNQSHSERHREYQKKIVNFLPFISGFNHDRPLFPVEARSLLANNSDTFMTLTVSLISYSLINPHLLPVDVYQVKPPSGIDKYCDCKKACGQVA